MMRPRTYLDWNATAPLRPEARAAVLDALDRVGNPSSVHAEGRSARRIIEDAREKVAHLAGARAADVVFTSSATEANNWAVRRSWRTILASRLEHPSVLAPAQANCGTLVEMPLTAAGQLDLTALARWLADHAEDLARAPGQALLALQAANNETGVIQPVAEAIELGAAYGVVVLSDAVQAAGRIPLAVAGSGLRYMTISSHKLGGPLGAGALIAGEGADVSPLLTGGGQERGRRAGTENVVAIAGFGAAAAAAAGELAYYGALAGLRDALEAAVIRATPDAVVIGRASPRLANTSCLALPGRAAETFVAALDLGGIAVSAGAACSSGKVTASATLAAMGLSPDIARAAIRVSIGPSTTPEHVAAFVAAWTNITRQAARAA